MRVLSRRRKFAKAVACGYSEGAGFTCSNGTPLASAPRSSCGAASTSPTASAGFGQASTRASRVQVCAGSVHCHVKHSRGRARCDGVEGATTPRRRRRGVSVAQRPREPGSWHSARPVHVPPPSAAEAGARRRRRAPAEDSSRRRRRAPPRAGDGCCDWFQSQGQRGNGTAVAHARRHKHCSTAAATTAHVVHRSLHCTHHR